MVRRVGPGFQLASNASAAASTHKFDDVLRFLAKQRKGLISQLIEELTAEGLERWRPDGVLPRQPGRGSAHSRDRPAPRPGAQDRNGRRLPERHPARDHRSPVLRLHLDYLTLDDGERPLECLLQHLTGEKGPHRLVRTFVRERGKVVYHSASDEFDVPFAQAATPSYAGLPLESYMAVPYDASRIQQLWSKRWNKLTLAHGCYWRKCTFSEISLD